MKTLVTELKDSVILFCKNTLIFLLLFRKKRHMEEGKEGRRKKEGEARNLRPNNDKSREYCYVFTQWSSGCVNKSLLQVTGGQRCNHRAVLEVSFSGR